MTVGHGLRAAVIFGILAAHAPAAGQCPEGPSPAPAAAFSAWGPVGQAGDAVVRFVDEIGSVVVRDERVDGALARFSPDGQTLMSLTAVRVDDGAPPCTTSHVWVRRHDLTNGSSARIARLRGGRPSSVRYSPTGRYVAIAVADDDDARLHLFDLETGRRLWVASAQEATWLDETQLVLRERHGRLSLNRATDGERVRVLAPPARRIVPYPVGADDTGLWATVGRRSDMRFARVRLVDERVRVEERAFELPRRPLAISADGARGALRTDEGIEVWNLEAGTPVATISGRPRYEAAAFSDDGRTLALVSDGAIELVALDGSGWISWGDPDPASELELVGASGEPTEDAAAR